MPYDQRDNIKRKRMDDDGPGFRGGYRGRGRGRGGYRGSNRDMSGPRDMGPRDMGSRDMGPRDSDRRNSGMEQDQRPAKRERALPSRVVQINQAEELTEDDIRSAIDVFGEIRGVVSPTRDIFLVEFSNMDSSQNFIQHLDNHGFVIRFVSPSINYGPAQDLTSAMAALTNSSNASGVNHVLQVNVKRPLYPITAEVLYTIASPHGRVLRIVIHNRTPDVVESLIEFDSVLSAESCKEAIHAADIYAGCCTLDVSYSKAKSLNVFKNDDDTCDYTDVNPAIAAGKRGPPSERFDDRRDRRERAPRGSDMHPSDMRGAPGVCPAVIMVYGLSEKMNPDRLFNLFCMYGDVNKIKFLMKKKGVAMVEMKEAMGADYVIQFLSRVRVFGSQLSISPSKHREVALFGTPGKLDDGSDAFQSYIGNRFNRYHTKAKASKNRQVDPSKILHFFALPLEVDEDFLLKLLEDNHCPTPTSISMHKSEVCSAGLLEFDTVEEAVETAAIANHLSGTHHGNNYLLKIAFTLKRSMPTESDKK